MTLTADLQRQLVNYIVEHSGHEPHRRYIGLSGISDCEQVIYDRYIHGTPATVSERMKTAISYDLESVMFAQGNAGGRFAWMVRFHWNGANYRFAFTPLECSQPNQINSYGGKRRTHTEQAKCQMGRIACHFVKAILTAAEAQPGALFGFMELPEAASGSGMPPVAADLDVSTLIDAAPLFQLPEIIVEEHRT